MFSKDPVEVNVQNQVFFPVNKQRSFIIRSVNTTLTNLEFYLYSDSSVPTIRSSEGGDSMPKKAAREIVELPHRHTARLRMLVMALTRARTVDRQSKSPWGQTRVLWVNGVSIDTLTRGNIKPSQEDFKVLAAELREQLQRMRGKTLAAVKACLGLDDGDIALRLLALGHHLKCWKLDLEGALGTGRLHDDEQIVIRDLRFN